MAATIFEEPTIRNTILKPGLPAMLGIINMVTAYYQALGQAMSSLLITFLRNIILFIPGVFLLNSLFGLYGAVAAQPVVETLLAVICIFMYIISRRKSRMIISETETTPA